jgi:hypothetical protein
MKLTNLILFSFIAAFISGCATTANYEKVLNTWVGVHVDSLVSSWGPPQGSYKLSDGGTVIEYIRSSNAQVGGYTYTTPQTTYHSGTASSYGNYGGYAYGNYSGAYTGPFSGASTTYVQQQTPTYNIHMSCKTRFTVSPNGIITGWTSEGNACRANDPGTIEGISDVTLHREQSQTSSDLDGPTRKYSPNGDRILTNEEIERGKERAAKAHAETLQKRVSDFGECISAPVSYSRDKRIEFCREVYGDDAMAYRQKRAKALSSPTMETAQPPTMEATYPESVKIENKEQWVAMIAKFNGCTNISGVSLNSKVGDREIYNVACSDKNMEVTCEFIGPVFIGWKGLPHVKVTGKPYDNQPACWQ